MSFVKSQILNKLADNYPNFLRRDLEKALNLVLLEIMTALAKGRGVEIRGFGSFKTRQLKARIGRNPRTGEQIQIAASQKVKFLPAKALKEVFNK